MPHRQDFVKKYDFSHDQRCAMKRRIACVFRAEGGIIHLGYQDNNWRGRLIRRLGEDAQPVLGKRRCKAHFALVQEAVDELLDSQKVVFIGAGAKMSSKYMEQQAGISRKLRKRAQGQDIKPQFKRRSVRRKDAVAA